MNHKTCKKTKRLLALVALAVASAPLAKAADIYWNGPVGSNSYNDGAKWSGGTVPGTNDNANVTNGTDRVVQINSGDPDWALSSFWAGNGAAVQNGQTLTLENGGYAFNLGALAGDTGTYTLNSGNINYNGGFNVGELGKGTLNINGGAINGNGNFAVNVGAFAIAITASMDGGTGKNGTTWYEQGYNTGAPAVGLPPAGSTFTSTAQADHSYTMAPSYKANNAVMIDSNVPNATITLTSSAAYSGLSFLGSGGNGQMTVSYTVHHADNTTETGNLVFADWFNTGTIALGVGGRSQADGTGLESWGAGAIPYLYSVDVTLTDPASPVTKIDLAVASGTGHACLMAVSGLTGGVFAPIGITGYNEDMVVEAGATTTVSSAITDTVNQTSGAITVTNGGQFFVGNVGNGVYNLHGGSIDVYNYIVFGRVGGSGTFNMTGGVLNQDGGGDFLVGTGFQAPSGGSAVGVLNQSGGTINCQGGFLVPENSPSTGTYTLSGTGALVANGWVVFGRGGATGLVNMSGGSILQTNSGGNFEVGEGSPGTLNQTGGSITTYNEFWIGQAAGAVGQHNMSGHSTLNLNNWLAIGRGNGDGTLNMADAVVITKGGNGNIIVGDGTSSSGAINQTNGTIFANAGDTYMGGSGTATWIMYGGTNYFNAMHLPDGTGYGYYYFNGGLLQVNSITCSSTGYGQLDLNGGTLQAKNDNPNFMSGISQVTVSGLGAIIDSQNYNITIAQNLSGNGGSLIKKGSGTLTLSGNNSFSGATVSAGTLVVNPYTVGSGDYSVADGAALGVVVTPSLNSTFYVGNLTLGNSTLNIDLGNYGTPTVAPLTVTAALAANGKVTLNIADGQPQLGVIPLIQYAAITGSGGFVIGSLPSGMAATIVTNAGAIALNVTTINMPRWDGQAGGNWDLGLTANWVNIGTGLSAVYNQGNPVLFNDAALGTTTVNLTTTVTPGALQFANDLVPYTVTGSGKISGTTGLTKSGAAVATIANTGGNTFTGPVVINGGTLSVASLANGGSPSAIGASSASPTNLVLANGTFSYTGPAASSDRGYSIQVTNSTIDVQNDLRLSGSVIASPASAFLKTGPAQFTYAGATTSTNILAGASGFNPGYHVVQGTVLFDGSNGHQTNRIQQDLWVGGTPATGASTILSNTTLFVDTWFALGRGNGTVGNVSTMTLYNSVFKAGNVSLGYANGIAGNNATQFLSLTNSTLTSGAFNLGENGGSVANLSMSNSTINCNGDVNFAMGGSTATVNISGNSLFDSQNRIQMGLGGSTGVVTIADSGSMRVENGNWFSVGNENNANISLIVKNNGNVFVGGDFNVTDTGTSTGSMTIQDNAVASGNAVYLAKNGGTVGTVTMSGGTVIARGGDLRVAGAGNGIWNQTGGTVIVTNWGVIARETGGVGVYNLSGGSLIKVSNNSRFNVGERGTGTLNVSGTGSVVMGAAQLDVTSDTGNGTINLDGGSITANWVSHVGSGTATFNFNGGTLIAGNNANPAFMAGLTTANVKSGGAKIDTAANIISIGQALLDGTGGGGLTKIGTGTLHLNGANTYTGPTLVSAGTLAGTGIIAGPVTVASSANIATGSGSIGTLTINNTLTLTAGSTTVMNLASGSNDQIAGLTGVTYAGSLVVTNNAGAGVFKLFNSAAAGAGNFTSVTVLPSGSGTFNPATGELTVTIPATLHPATFANGNLNVTGAGGIPGTTYSVLTSTNVSAPLSAWTTNTAGIFDSTGAFSNAIPIISGSPARFFLIKTP